MNIFGAFTFGSLIKTFLPGVVWLLAFGVLEKDIAQALGYKPFILSFVQTKEQASLVLGFPTAILLGLMSNIVVFMGLNDWLVRNPVKKAQPRLFSLYDRLATRIRDHCWRELTLDDQMARRQFDANTDVEFVILPALGPEKLAYVREQYWYHMEFQMNLFLSLLALLIGVAVNARNGATSFWELLMDIGIYLILFVPVLALLLIAARKNYARHMSKMLSLMAGVLCPQPEKKPDVTPRRRVAMKSSLSLKRLR